MLGRIMPQRQKWLWSRQYPPLVPFRSLSTMRKPLPLACRLQNTQQNNLTWRCPLRPVCHVLLYEGLLSPSGRFQRQRNQFFFRRRPFWQLWPVCLRSGQGRHPWPVTCRRNRMGQRWHQCEYHLPAGLGLPTGEVLESLSRRISGQRKNAAHGTLWRF